MDLREPDLQPQPSARVTGWRWALTLPLFALVWMYRRFVSPVLPPACRYYPSCAQYASEALLVHGPVRGSWLAGRRLLRCHPFCEGGLDPVPPRAAPRTAPSRSA